MSIYDKVWTYTNGYEWMTCLQIVATHAFLKTAELEAFRCPFQVSVKHEQPQQRSARFEEIQNISKHACFAFPNWCMQKRLVKNDSTIFKNLQATRQVWESCRFCRFFGLLGLAFLPFSASWTTAGSVAITSFFLRAVLSTVYCCDLLCNARFCRWPSKVLPLWSLGQDVRALGCLGNTGMKRTKMKYHEMTWKIVR